MNKISIQVEGIQIDCEPSAFQTVFQALRSAVATNVSVKISEVQENAKESLKEAPQPSATLTAPATDTSVGDNKSKLIKLMDRWNRLHTKEVSVRGRRFSNEDRKLLNRIATAARDESASVTWVAHTCRVCPATIHRAMEWVDTQ